MTRVTLAVPAAFMEACNHTMVMLGKTTALNTYAAAGHEDESGNPYAVSSGLWTDAQLAGVTDPDVLQGIIDAGEVPEIVDIDQVMLAGSVFVLSAHVIPASPDAITGLVGDDPIAIIAAMGLTAIEVAV